MFHSDHQSDESSDDDSNGDSDRSSIDEHFGFEWLEQLNGAASIRDNDEEHTIAFCRAKLIRRDMIRPTFWREMDEPDAETSDLAFELFDRYGRLQQQYINHDVKKGTGVWGKELDHGDILLIEHVSVKQPWQRKGLATKLLTAVLDKARQKIEPSIPLIAVTFPGPPLDVSEAFFRFIGFRRVGISDYFALTDTPDHPSRHLKSTDDYSPPAELDTNMDPVWTSVFAWVRDLKSYTDDECFSQLKIALEAVSAAETVVDNHGNTIVHVAAGKCRLELLIQIATTLPQLIESRNRKGLLPLDALREAFEKSRTTREKGMMTVDMSDRFVGFPHPAVQCLGLLANIPCCDLTKYAPSMIDAAISATDAQLQINPELVTIRKTLVLKYGCTCGQCIGGFLSPRMCLALKSQAEIAYDMTQEDVEDGPFWVQMYDYYLGNLLVGVRNNMRTNKSMRQGFTNMFKHIIRCLDKKLVPNQRSLLATYESGSDEWPPVTKNFLNRGGTVESVATIVFEQAMAHDECAGNGEARQLWGDEIDKLPACRNDHEFGFVAKMCGYKPRTQNYY